MASSTRRRRRKKRPQPLSNVHLPEERLRIGELLAAFPAQRETKVQKLLDGLGTLWRQNPNEKIVIFATYLGTVDLLANQIEQTYPGQGVVVLRGGDHGAKVAAERRFSRRMVRACWSARRRAEKASTSNSPASCSISTCRGIRWTWSSASGASTATGRSIRRRSTISFCRTRSRAGSSCCSTTS